MRSLFLICIALSISLFIAFFTPSCQKSRGEAPRVSAAVSTCSDTAGIYFPTVVTSLNSVVFAMNQAHFTRVCDQVYVSGTIACSNAIDTLQSSFLKLSLPIASDLGAPPVLNLAGQAMVQQIANVQPLNAPVGLLYVAIGSGAVISWHATKKAPYSIVYSYSYTVQ
jgi:hypothetical protein